VKPIFKLLVAAVAVAATAGCASNPDLHARGCENPNYAGAVIGGLAGGLLGAQVGSGSGRTAATAVGAGTGAVVGSQMGCQ
jgi:uncharacterized protein YcfJ